MAQIFLARQSGLGAFERHVVLKTILRERAQDQRFVTMFLDEAKLAATLNHQNVAQVYEVDHADGAYFMAMEYVHGENARAILETTLRRGWTIPLELAVMIVSGAAAGLHHAHERRGKGGQPLNIVHRDVSPQNVMVATDGTARLLDFGVAKATMAAHVTRDGTFKNCPLPAQIYPTAPLRPSKTVIPGQPEGLGPEPMNTGLWNIASGLATVRRSGMTIGISARRC